MQFRSRGCPWTDRRSPVRAKLTVRAVEGNTIYNYHTCSTELNMKKSILAQERLHGDRSAFMKAIQELVVGEWLLETAMAKLWEALTWKSREICALLLPTYVCSGQCFPGTDRWQWRISLSFPLDFSSFNWIWFKWSGGARNNMARNDTNENTEYIKPPEMPGFDSRYQLRRMKIEHTALLNMLLRTICSLVRSYSCIERITSTSALFVSPRSISSTCKIHRMKNFPVSFQPGHTFDQAQSTAHGAAFQPTFIWVSSSYCTHSLKCAIRLDERSVCEIFTYFAPEHYKWYEIDMRSLSIITNAMMTWIWDWL